jgi:hypothetical protein
MTRIYLVVVSDDNGRAATVVCAVRDEEVATELAARAGGEVESVLLVDDER